jgi:hypothetical protein
VYGDSTQLFVSQARILDPTFLWQQQVRYALPRNLAGTCGVNFANQKVVVWAKYKSTFNIGAAGGFNKSQFVEGPILLDSEVPTKTVPYNLLPCQFEGYGFTHSQGEYLIVMQAITVIVLESRKG